MRDGECAEGSVLRAKIDMAHSNLLMRDPIMYRIQHKEHHRTGNTFAVYPLYDWAHGLEDSIEGAPIRSVPQNSKRTARFMTGSLTNLAFTTHNRLSLIA